MDRCIFGRDMYIFKYIQFFFQFYSISSCLECSNEPELAEETYTELRELAANKSENFILITDFYFINQLLDRVTNATIGEFCEVKNAEKTFRVYWNFFNKSTKIMDFQ